MVENRSLAAFLLDQGYDHVKRLPDGIYLCIGTMFVTTGLFVGVTEGGYEQRYCYERRADAIEALESWDGKGLAPGNWIKRKGVGGEINNPNRTEEKQE